MNTYTVKTTDLQTFTVNGRHASEAVTRFVEEHPTYDVDDVISCHNGGEIQPL